MPTCFSKLAQLQTCFTNLLDVKQMHMVDSLGVAVLLGAVF